MNKHKIPAALAFFIAWIVVTVLFVSFVSLFRFLPPEPDFTLCPLCSRPVPPSESNWPLHPNTP